MRFLAAKLNILNRYQRRCRSVHLLIINKMQTHHGKCNKNIPIKTTTKTTEPADLLEGFSVTHLYTNNLVQNESFLMLY
jgi:hypothetical protein